MGPQPLGTFWLSHHLALLCFGFGICLFETVSLCSPGWPQTHKSPSCLHFPGVGVTDRGHQSGLLLHDCVEKKPQVSLF